MTSDDNTDCRLKNMACPATDHTHSSFKIVKHSFNILIHDPMTHHVASRRRWAWNIIPQIIAGIVSPSISIVWKVVRLCICQQWKTVRDRQKLCICLSQTLSVMSEANGEHGCRILRTAVVLTRMSHKRATIKPKTKCMHKKHCSLIGKFARIYYNYSVSLADVDHELYTLSVATFDTITDT